MADNGSDDGTRPYVERWCELHSRFRLADASARRGESAARNIGVRAARGRMLAFCDADDVVRPGWLVSMWAALADADLVAGVFDFGALNGGPASDPVPAATRQLGFLPFALGANLAVRKDVFDAVHGCCEDLPMGVDVDLCWRIQLAGYRFAVAADAMVEKRERAAGLPTFRGAWAYGRCGPRLYVRYAPRACGATFRERQSRGSGWRPRLQRSSIGPAGVKWCARSLFVPAASPVRSTSACSFRDPSGRSHAGLSIKRSISGNRLLFLRLVDRHSHSMSHVVPT